VTTHASGKERERAPGDRSEGYCVKKERTAARTQFSKGQASGLLGGKDFVKNDSNLMPYWADLYKKSSRKEKGTGGVHISIQAEVGI